jgi:hypothetical protein
MFTSSAVGGRGGGGDSATSNTLRFTHNNAPQKH